MHGLAGRESGKVGERKAFLNGLPRADNVSVEDGKAKPAKPVHSRKGALLGAALAADAVVAQEDALRVQPPLDLQQPRVLLAPLVLRNKARET